MKTNGPVDLFKLHAADYAAKRKPALVSLSAARYLAVEGKGAPGEACFQERIGALYAVAYTVKMTRKFAGEQDYVIGKLEAQYFFPPGDKLPPKADWRWRMLIRTPEFVREDELEAAVRKLLDRGKPPAVKLVKLATLEEKTCVQMLHVGPYEREGETLAVMREFARGRDLKFAGPHHEIYLSDPRRVAPERLKTILRMPVVKA